MLIVSLFRMRNTLAWAPEGWKSVPKLLGPCTRLPQINRYGGTVIKFAGDAMICAFTPDIMGRGRQARSNAEGQSARSPAAEEMALNRCAVRAAYCAEELARRLGTGEISVRAASLQGTHDSNLLWLPLAGQSPLRRSIRVMGARVTAVNTCSHALAPVVRSGHAAAWEGGHPEGGGASGGAQVRVGGCQREREREAVRAEQRNGVDGGGGAAGHAHSGVRPKDAAQAQVSPQGPRARATTLMWLDGSSGGGTMAAGLRWRRLRPTWSRRTPCRPRRARRLLESRGECGPTLCTCGHGVTCCQTDVLDAPDCLQRGVGQLNSAVDASTARSRASRRAFFHKQEQPAPPQQPQSPRPCLCR